MNFLLMACLFYGRFCVWLANNIISEGTYNMEYYNELPKQLPVVYTGDVIVAGGGTAGITAAVAAKRSGAERVLLIEKGGFLGGMLTAGGVMNLRQFSDGAGGCAVAGIPYEFARLIWEMGGIMHEPYDRDGEFAPEKFLHIRAETEISKYAAQKFCLDSGVEILLHTAVASVIKEGSRITGVITEGKSGREVLKAGVIIDCTGDGDIMEYSGTAYLKDDKSVIQPMTLTFVLGNAAVGQWPVTLTDEQAALHRRLYSEGKYPVKNSGMGLFAGFRENEVYFNATRCPGDATDTRDITAAELECRRQMFEITEYFRKYMKGYENCYIKSSAAQIGLRETRRLLGVYTLKKEDIEEYRQFDDGIMRNNYMFDMHRPGETTDHIPLKKGSCYSVPYRCLIPRETDGLIVAGRCISVTREALSSVRVMVAAMALGHAAGTAAAIAVCDKVLPRNVNICKLRKLLAEQGAVI